MGGEGDDVPEDAIDEAGTETQCIVVSGQPMGPCVHEMFGEAGARVRNGHAKLAGETIRGPEKQQAEADCGVDTEIAVPSPQRDNIHEPPCDQQERGIARRHHPANCDGRGDAQASRAWEKRDWATKQRGKSRELMRKSRKVRSGVNRYAACDAGNGREDDREPESKVSLAQFWVGSRGRTDARQQQRVQKKNVKAVPHPERILVEKKEHHYARGSNQRNQGCPDLKTAIVEATLTRSYRLGDERAAFGAAGVLGEGFEIVAAVVAGEVFEDEGFGGGGHLLGIVTRSARAVENGGLRGIGVGGGGVVVGCGKSGGGVALAGLLEAGPGGVGDKGPVDDMHDDKQEPDGEGKPDGCGVGTGNTRRVAGAAGKMKEHEEEAGEGIDGQDKGKEDVCEPLHEPIFIEDCQAEHDGSADREQAAEDDECGRKQKGRPAENKRRPEARGQHVRSAEGMREQMEGGEDEAGTRRPLGRVGDGQAAENEERAREDHDAFEQDCDGGGEIAGEIANGRDILEEVSADDHGQKHERDACNEKCAQKEPARADSVSMPERIGDQGAAFGAAGGDDEGAEVVVAFVAGEVVDDGRVGEGHLHTIVTRLARAVENGGLRGVGHRGMSGQGDWGTRGHGDTEKKWTFTGDGNG